MAAVPRKKSVDILTTLSEDDEQRYLWQFILDTKTEGVKHKVVFDRGDN